MINSQPADNMMGKKNPVLMKSKHRVQKHGEVFTPQWVVDKMVAIPGIKEKTEDVFATFLEPSAGEGAFLLAIEDIKLRFVTDNHGGDVWNTYALWALSSIYGIEFLEDNLEAARQNMLELFLDYYDAAQGAPLSKRSDLYKSARTIIWANVVQGDTLTHKNNSGEEIVFSRWNSVEGSPRQVRRATFSYSSLFGDDDISKSGVQLSLFDQLSAHEEAASSQQECFALIDIELVWKEEKDMSEKKSGKFKFDVVIGNPPYQEEAKGESGRAEPIYHLFMDEAYKIAKRVSFITPARFLYNAGQTPKAWNKKMLEDEHLKIEFIEQDSSKVFSNTDIKGGIAVTYRDEEQVYGSIGVFIHYDELNTIASKIAKISIVDFSTIVQPQGIYRFSEQFFSDFPQAEDIQGKGTKNKIVSKSFSQMDFAFHSERTSDEICMLGLVNGRREYKWILPKYLALPESFEKYRVIIAETNNTGVLGETLSSPLIGVPFVAHTDTFLTVGAFNTEAEANAVLKYIKSKFARVLLGILKITQHNSRSTWAKVPLQDFTPASDIDWTQPIRGIDQQLYKKYGLDETEVEFIESHVKEME